MSTPTSNSTPVTVFDRANTAVPWLVGTGKWGGALGTRIDLTYSFSANPATFKPNYGDGLNEPGSMQALAAFQKTAIAAGLAAWSLVADITFVQVAESATEVGDVRFGISSKVARTGHAYLPEDVPEAGDVWFSPVNWTDNLQRGSFDAYVILHEIGHALGLEHTFSAPVVAPTQFDNHFYSIMAYKASPWSDPVTGGTGTFYPTTPMFYDILAMQSMYGKNLSANTGDTTYTFNQGTQYFETIYDTGGNDTIRFVGTEACTINLVIGAFSSLSATISFDGGASKETVCIGPSTVIENAIGGDGDDHLIGNSAANVLQGSGGGDTLEGAGGGDTLDGGAGNDDMIGGGGNDIYIVGEGGDTITEAAGGGTDLIRSVISQTLGAEVENLTLKGAAAINGVGNALANTLTGNGAGNTLNGGGGADVLRGGGGNDLLNGGLGADTLTGGAGADLFVFNAAPGAANRDAITDYNVADDTIRLENSVFVGLGAAGALAAGKFFIGAAAHDAGDRIIYDAATGALYFDTDGVGGASQIQFATLSAGLALTAADFVVI